MRASTFLLAAWFVGCGPGAGTKSASSVDNAGVSQELTAQLTRAAADWNRGDLDGFVSDYAPESTTTFVDRGHSRHGFDFIRERYRPRFEPGAQRDSLHFEELEVRPLRTGLALVTGRYVLQRAGQITSSGPFTLVMESRPQGWRILHDHTSSDPR